MNAGDLALHDYGEVPEVLHSRLLLAQVVGDSWIILTPDHDMYEEQLSPHNPDLKAFYFLGPGGAIPGHLNAANVYGFAPILPNRMANYYVQGRALADAARVARGLHAPVPPAVAPAMVPPPPAPVPGVLAGALPAPVPLAAPAAPLLANTWISLEDKGRIKRGDVLAVDPAPLPPGHVAAGDRALVPIDGECIFARKVKPEEVAQHKLEDIRILPVTFDGQGVRRREFANAVMLLEDVNPQGGGLQLEGPATVLKFVKMLRDSSQTPSTFHEFWIRTSEIPKGDRSVYEHECLARILESMLTVDQLHVSSLQSAELLSRRMLVIREAHKTSPGAPDYSAADITMGWRFRRGAQGVVPEMSAYVAQELKNEAAVMKEARKAKEEAKLRRQDPKGNKSKGQNGGNDQ